MRVLHSVNQRARFEPKRTSDTFVALIPSMAEQRAIVELLEEMTTFCVVMGRLQRERQSFSSVRDIFDVGIDEYEGMEDYLASDANIVAFPGFESGLVKLQSAAEATLTPLENQNLQRLRRRPVKLKCERRRQRRLS